MAEQSAFRETIVFLNKLGLYDVILPFLLVFTVMFAILEKTKILGVEKVGEQAITRKNLHAMTSFVVAFFVVASSRLVEIITSVSANAVLLLMLAVLFMMLYGALHASPEKGDGALHGVWKSIFIGIMFMGIIVIFLNALKIGSESWLEFMFRHLSGFWGGTDSNRAVSSIILSIVVVLILVFVTRSPSPKSTKEAS